jgi:hypothetical protein
MPTVELIYNADCPHVGEARAQLLRAFAQAGVPPRWTEWRAGAPDSPPHVAGYGSPTILVDGVDVAGAAPGDGASCRLYGERGALQPVPAIATIAAALQRRPAPGPPTQRGGWRSSLSALPGVVTALLPKVACPACWPAYAGLLGSLGLGFLTRSAYLLPLTAVFLVLAVAALGWRARTRRGHGPLALGLLASAIILVGKFAVESDVALYGGVALLIGASLWNAWPRRPAPACQACATP